MKTKLLAGTSLLIGLSQSDLVYAEELKLEEIVVTAQKRTENLMEVPIAITALSTDALNDTGAKNLMELQGVAPSIYFSGNTGYSVSPIAIRGTSGTGNALGDEPVAVYVDGVFQNAQTIATGDLADVKSIEVVRGPQGTLQGRNSTAGAVLIRTADPEQTFGGYAMLSISRPTEYRAQGALTGAVTDTLAARLSVSFYDELGWANNTYTGTRAGGSSGSNVRGILRWQPSSSTSARLSLGYAQSDSSVAVARWAQTTVNPSGQAVTAGTPQVALTSTQQSNILDSYNVALNLIPRSKIANPYLALEANIDFGTFELVSITGANRFSIDGQMDSDGLAFTDRQGYNVNHISYKTYSQELRLQSVGTERLTWIAGAYATRIVGDQNIRLYNLQFTSGRNQYLRSDAHQVGVAYAPFADVTYKVLDSLSVTGGLRYTGETKDFTRYSGFFDAFTDAAFTTPSAPGTYSPATGKFHDLSYRAKVSYFPAGGTLIYASYSEGFKSGGYNALGNDPVFEPETLISTEVGAKVDVSSRVQLTGAIYHNNYDNLQVTAGIAQGGVATRNAAKATIDGAELEARILATEKLTLETNVAYTDAKYANFPLPTDVSGTVIPSATGNHLARAPEWQYFAKASYAFDLSGDWSGELQASWRWRDKIYFFATNQDATNLQSPANGELGARLNVLNKANDVRLSLYGTNLNNSRVVTNEQSLFGYPVASFNKPRSISLEISKKF